MTPSQSAANASSGLIDTNVYLSRWPSRRLVGDETPALLDLLRKAGVTSAWAGSFDALLHRDIAAVNTRLVEECARAGRGVLLPMGAVNPTLPDWEEDLRRCHEVHRMRGIRLHPNYHEYKLTDPRCLRLLELAAQRGLLVQIALLMEDDRTQHPLLRVPAVDASGLPEIMEKIPGVRIMLLNALRGSLVINRKLLGELVKKKVRFDIAVLEGFAGVESLWANVPDVPLVFGSYAPFFHVEAARLKLQESKLTPEQRAALGQGNARSALESAGQG